MALNVSLMVPEDIIDHLGRGQDHWKPGRSAYELAYSWYDAGGIPPTVRALLDSQPLYRGAQMIDGFFERTVNLGTRGADSQTDLMVIAAIEPGLAAIAIEGKAGEPFGPLVAEWNTGTAGRVQRLAGLCATLGLEPAKVGDLRYQLFHRAAAAVYEAKRYRGRHALFVVQSFAEHMSANFDDFARFAAAVGFGPVIKGVISEPKICDGVALRVAWVADRPRQG
jgi:hypothetical protein